MSQCASAPERPLPVEAPISPNTSLSLASKRIEDSQRKHTHGFATVYKEIPRISRKHKSDRDCSRTNKPFTHTQRFTTVCEQILRIQGSVCLLSSPQPGFFLHLLLRTPPDWDWITHSPPCLRLPFPENQGGAVAVVTGLGDEYALVQRSLGQWDGPRLGQEQLSKRVSEVGS
jgi:hypothetical protein